MAVCGFASPLQAHGRAVNMQVDVELKEEIGTHIAYVGHRRGSLGRGIRGLGQNSDMTSNDTLFHPPGSTHRHLNDFIHTQMYANSQQHARRYTLYFLIPSPCPGARQRRSPCCRGHCDSAPNDEGQGGALVPSALVFCHQETFLHLSRLKTCDAAFSSSPCSAAQTGCLAEMDYTSWGEARCTADAEPQNSNCNSLSKDSVARECINS
eukprot:1137735-Pelagomonas_calceolata.AAC.2